MIPDPATPSHEDRPPSRRARRRLEPAHAVRARRRRLLGWAVFGVSCLLMVNALVGDNGYLATVRAQREYDALEASLAKIRYENLQLRNGIRRMHDDLTALEEVARGEHGLMRPGETVVILKDPSRDTPAPNR